MTVTMLEATPTRLSKGQMLAYCLYAAPLVATAGAINSFIPGFYSEEFGMPLAVISASLLFVRVFDALVDPVLGWAFDLSPFRRQHRPWLLLALPIYVVSIGLMYFPIPALMGQTYLVVVACGMYLAYTIGTIAHQAWGAALARDQRAMSVLFGYREVAVIGGLLGVFGMAAAAESSNGAFAAKAGAAGGFIIVGICICTLITCAFTPDPVQPRRRDRLAQSGGAAGFFMKRNPIVISLATLAINFSLVAGSTTLAFVAKHLFGAADKYAMGLALMFLCAPIGMFVWMTLAKRIGDKWTFVVGGSYLAVVYASLPLVATLGQGGYFLYTALLGIGFGVGPYLLRSLMGVVANHFEAEAGRNVRGIAFAVTTFFDKLGSGVGATTLMALAALGFDPKLPVGLKEEGALILVATATPFTAVLLSVVLICLVRPHPKLETPRNTLNPEILGS